LLGLVLNIVLFIFLCRSYIGKVARLYRIACMITALLNLYTSFLLLLLLDVVLLVDGCLAVVLYGEILFFFPDQANDILAVSFFTHVHTMWQTLSVPSIVQWMYLEMSNAGAVRKLVYAYAITVLLYANTLYLVVYLFRDRSFRAELEKKI
ncbi:hypothetical protein PMAYCL1PPCAC_17072, partial [Pristionchus mayeri]